MSGIRTIILHETPLISNILESLLTGEEDIEVLIATSNIDEAYHEIPNCDIALVSTRLPHQEALKFIHSVASSYPQVRVLVIGLTETETEIIRFLEAGARGYVVKEDSMEELIHQIHAAYRGETLISAQLAAVLVSRQNQIPQPFDVTTEIPGATELTPREKEILELLNEDLSNLEIAEKLTIAVGTVKNHVHRILKKLKVSNRHEAAAYWPVIAKSDQAPKN